MAERRLVDLWSVHLDSVPKSLSELLCSEERSRALGLPAGTVRSRWRACRAVLRLLLSGRLRVDPQSLRFELGAHGKPRLVSAAEHFNISHSGPLALYAFCADAEVGVDVELISASSRRRNEVAIASRLFGQEAARRLASLPERERSLEFLSQWVRHEAVVKCIGCGIGHALDELRSEDLPSVLDVELDSALAAVAVASSAAEVRMHEWTVQRAEGDEVSAEPGLTGARVASLGLGRELPHSGVSCLTRARAADLVRCI